MLDHLVSAAAADYVPELVSDEKLFTPLEKLDAAETLNAQIKTSDWLKELADEDDVILERAQEERVNEVFAAVIAEAPNAKGKVLGMHVPEEIRASVAMVSTYQWKFIEQAEELRAMSVAKIVKETDHPDARIRLKALELLGKVTEVALFTERVEIKREELSDDELEKRIREKLGRYMGKADIVDAEIKEEKSEDKE